MFFKRGRKGAGAILISFALMAFSVILRPKEQSMESVQNETRRKKDAQAGDPKDPAGGKAE